MAIEMKIKGLMIDPVSNMPIIVLKSDAGDSVLPIWVGIFEANAIATQLENIVSPRPMTHDLLRDAIEKLGGTIRRVVISDLRDNTFYANLEIDQGGSTVLIDARPSDAMALALRAGASILVEEAVIERSTGSGEGTDSDSVETERLRRWLETVDPEELGKYEM